jgi:hypothetical protein
MKRTFQLSFLAISIACPNSLAQSSDRAQSSRGRSEAKGSRELEQHLMVDRGVAHIEVIAQSSGPVIVILPWLGRRVEDYDIVAARLVSDGFRVLRPQTRPHVGNGPAGFGARCCAGSSPGRQGTGTVHELPVSPEVRETIDKSSDLSLREAERLRYLQLAFFAPGHEPHAWLGGWHADAMKAENAASAATPVEEWFACGQARILNLHAENDTVAPRKFAGMLKAALGDRVAFVVIPNAGHALPEEQPQAMSEVIAAFARAL